MSIVITCPNYRTYETFYKVNPLISLILLKEKSNSTEMMTYIRILRIMFLVLQKRLYITDIYFASALNLDDANNF